MTIADAFRGLTRHSVAMTRTLIEYRKILVAITRVEMEKRYSGSALGKAWVLLYPALLLSIYIFVYMFVFKMRFPGYTEADYTLFVFAGLIPYLGFSEAITTGSVSIKQNMHLVKNVMLPIELVPVKMVAVSMVTQLVSLVILVALSGLNGNLSLHLLWLPLVIAFQMIFLVGLVWILAALAVPLPDIGYFVNLAVLLLMFLSPIGFTPDMVPPIMRVVVYLNPLHYMMEMYRASIIHGSAPNAFEVVTYVSVCVAVFVVGATFFRKFKNVLVDYE